jgi:hypothetical protein
MLSQSEIEPVLTLLAGNVSLRHRCSRIFETRRCKSYSPDFRTGPALCAGDNILRTKNGGTLARSGCSAFLRDTMGHI